MTDLGFPVIRYESGKTFREWGLYHGETYRQGIKELVKIRRELLVERNPKLVGKILTQECEKQWEATKVALPSQFEELEGIRLGAGLTVEEVVIINAYTDIRDIQNLDDQGCSTFLKSTSKKMIAGQTWDMHASAKNYLCVIEVPEHFDSQIQGLVPKQFIYSLVGTVALMGFTAAGEMLAVNNLNANNAKSAVIWPAFVRALLCRKGLSAKRHLIENVPLTSARCFMLANKNEGANIWEIFPSQKVIQDSVNTGQSKTLFHTNHCLNSETKKLEAAHSQASTTHERYRLIGEKSDSVNTFQDLLELFQSHDNYPKSICSHYQSGAQDPSHTCGGAATDFSTGEIVMWRGCPVYEKSIYKELRLNF